VSSGNSSDRIHGPEVSRCELRGRGRQGRAARTVQDNCHGYGNLLTEDQDISDEGVDRAMVQAGRRPRQRRRAAGLGSVLN